MEDPITKDWDSLQSACFCYCSEKKEKCCEQFLRYIFKKSSFEQVLSTFLWNQQEWKKEDYTLRRDAFIRHSRGLDLCHSDSTWRSENKSDVSSEQAQTGMKRTIVSYCNSQKKQKVGISKLDETPLTTSKMKMFAK